MISDIFSKEDERSVKTTWDGLSNALNLWDVEEDIRHRILSSRQLCVFLDYDGTLTPIVSDPDKSFISNEMRDLIAKLSAQSGTDVAIVSGRCISKLQHFLRLSNLYLSGSHGAEILCPATASHPNGMRMTVAEDLEELKQAEQEVRSKLRAWPGCHIEDNKFVFSVHYRNAQFQLLPGRQKRDQQRVLEDELRAIATRRNLRMDYGKKVYEIKPNGSWDKGEAVLSLIKQVLQLHEPKVWEEEDITCLEDREEEDDSSGRNEDTPSWEDSGEEVSYEEVGSDGNEDPSRNGPPFYFFVGDDCSDEHAFAALKANYPYQSLGILVSSKPRKTEASCWLKNPDEVYEFLNLLLKKTHEEVNSYRYNDIECVESMSKMTTSSTGSSRTPTLSESSALTPWYWS